MGPLYCETPLELTGFPVESLNTWSNLFIIALGILAIVLVARRPVREGAGMWFLALLLTATGIGSFLWHGTRNESFLAFDAIPGLFFLLVAVYAWLRRFYRWWSAGLLFLAFIGIEALVIYFSAALRINSLFIGLTPGIVLAGAWLVARTYQETVRAAALGGGALLLALFALFFRTIDLSVCASFPLGTHFLWHILLSVGALLLILTLIVIDYTRAKRLNRNIMLDT